MDIALPSPADVDPSLFAPPVLEHNAFASTSGAEDVPRAASQGLNGTSPADDGPSHPKRGSKACLACRRGKNRCAALSTRVHAGAYVPRRCQEADNPPCKRCRQTGTECVFDTKPPRPTPGEALLECVPVVFLRCS